MINEILSENTKKVCVPDQTSLKIHSLTFELHVWKVVPLSGLPTSLFLSKQTRPVAQLVSTRPLLLIYLQCGSNLPVKVAQCPQPPTLSSATGGAHSRVAIRAVALCIGHFPPAAAPPLPRPLLLLSSRARCR